MRAGTLQAPLHTHKGTPSVVSHPDLRLAYTAVGRAGWLASLMQLCNAPWSGSNALESRYTGQGR